MAIDYRIVSIENFKDDAASEAALDAEGVSDWDLVQATYSPQVDSTVTALCIFKK